MVRIILISFILIFCFSCKEKQEIKSFGEYNIEFYSHRVGTYNFKENTFSVDEYFRRVYYDYLTKEEQDKIVNSFFENKLDEKSGELFVFEDPVVMPSAANAMHLFKNKKDYFFASVGLNHKQVNFCTPKSQKEMIIFNDVVISILSSKESYKRTADTLRKIDEQLWRNMMEDSKRRKARGKK